MPDIIRRTIPRRPPQEDLRYLVEMALGYEKTIDDVGVSYKIRKRWGKTTFMVQVI